MNMSYSIYIANEAFYDLNATIDYIEYGLKNPTAGEKLHHKFFEAARLLSFSPTMYPIIHDIFLSHLRIRFVPVDNYLLFYTIADKLSEVRILRFLYAKSDWRTILKSSPNTFYVELEHKDHYVNEDVAKFNDQ